jgi:hypothetical protein
MLPVVYSYWKKAPTPSGRSMSFERKIEVQKVKNKNVRGQIKRVTIGVLWEEKKIITLSMHVRFIIKFY